MQALVKLLRIAQDDDISETLEIFNQLQTPFQELQSPEMSQLYTSIINILLIAKNASEAYYAYSFF